MVLISEHIHSAGLKDQAISKSIGGNSSKIHLAVDSYGNPIEIIITNGTTHDVKVAPELVEKLDLEETDVLCADKGYDSEPLREQISATNTKANIPRKSNTQSNNNHMDWNLSLYTTNFIGPLSYQAFSFLKLLALS